MTTIRVAVASDIPRIVEMGLAFLRVSSYRAAFAENAGQMTSLATRLITQPDGDFLVLDRDGRAVGMIGLVAFDHFISGQRTASEVVYWVEPDARGRGLQLLRGAEAWAKAHGAVLMQMISPAPRVDALYTRLGYAPIERIFQRAL